MNSVDSKLIITATVAPSWIYPQLRRWPQTAEEYATEVVAAYEAGASVAHIHGKEVWTKEFYQKVFDLIRDDCDIILQMGLSALKIEQRINLLETKPEMLSIILNHHDEYFPELKLRMMHTQEELVEYTELCNKFKIKPEFEQWHQGSNWNLRFLAERGLIEKPYFLSMFFAWPGGIWSPPTVEEVMYRFKTVPDGSMCTLSCMDDEQTKLATMAILLGGHARVGYEDNPYYAPGVPARSVSELVARIKRIGTELNRKAADPTDARKMIGLKQMALIS